jgi:tetratricopeptide (TPR) repeat protein
MIYAGFYDLGAAAYNKKDFRNSFQAFSKALEAEEYIVNKGYKFDEIKFAAFDTALIMNAALAAVQSNDTVGSIMLYSRFLDNGIVGEDSKQVYEIVVDHYVRKGDVANANKYIKIAKERYPESKDVWNEYAVKLIGKDNKEVLYAQYDKMLSEDPTNFTISYNYAVEIYNSLYAAGETRPTDLVSSKKKLTELLNIAISSDKGMDASMLMINHLFNITAEYSLEENAEKVAAKKVEKKKKTLDAANAVIPYAEKVLSYINNIAEPSIREKADKKNILGYLMDIYSIKGDQKKADEYEKLRTAVKI